MTRGPRRTLRVRVGPLSWRAWEMWSEGSYTGGVYWRDKIVWTLTWWGLSRKVGKL